MNEAYNLKLKDFSMEAIAESGQCFRINRIEAGNIGKFPEDRKNTECVCQDADNKCIGSCFRVNAKGKVLDVFEETDGSFTFFCSKEEFEKIWKDYFDFNNDYEKYRAAVLPEDRFLNEAVRFGMGIRILNQDPWEMLISFIISQRKSVPAIRTSVERLSRMFGKRIEGTNEYTFPLPEALSSADTDRLSSCGLGYRVEYVRNAAQMVCAGEFDLFGMEKYSTDELIEKLMELKGVGIKVASCIALFGYHRLDVMPKDVWMNRVIDEVYGGSIPGEYIPYAGVLQQYMFNYARLKKGDFGIIQGEISNAF